MPNLPYLMLVSARKDKAFDDVACVIQQYLDGAITDDEVVMKIVEIMSLAGVVFD